MKNNLEKFYLSADLDGMTVGQFREALSCYKDSDKIDVRTETEYGGFGSPSTENEYFVIVKEK